MAAILRAPFCSYKLTDLMDMTDRQLYEIFVEGAKKEDREPDMPMRGSHEKKSSTYKDDTGFTWDLPEPTDTPLAFIDGKPMDGETALNNLAKAGLLKWEDVKRVKAERQAYLDSLKGGSHDDTEKVTAG